MAGKFELKKSSGGQFMFNLRASNGRVVLTSERYSSKTSALNGIKSVQRNSSKDARFERKKFTKGQPYFVLTAPNGEVIGRSEMYSSSTGMTNGIRSVMGNASGAKIDDRT